MKVLLITLILLLPFGIKCQQGILSFESKTIELGNNKNKGDDFKLSDIGSSINYIQLETTKECIIGSAFNTKLEISNSYVLVATYGQKAFLFNRSGKYLAQIGNFGGGPKEYNSIDNIIIDEAANRILIFDQVRNCMQIYDTKGVYSGTVAVPNDLRTTVRMGDGTFCGVSIPHDNNELEKAKFTKWNGELDKIIFEFPLYKNFVPGEGYKFGNTLLIKEINKTIFYAENPFNSIQIVNSDHGVRNFLTLKKPSELNPLRIFLSDNFLFLTGADPRLRNIVYDFNVGATNFCDIGIDLNGPDLYGIINDIDGGLPFWPKTITNSNEYVGLVDPIVFVEYVNDRNEIYGTKKYPDKSSSFRAFATKLNPNDNPIVIIVN